ncbi:2OG-Fe(II) oxygenase [Candidatus Pelagibacter sp.]|nr:2OG-Fe(II) oxygenase [Candidatus Pelagibacter sp.]
MINYSADYLSEIISSRLNDVILEKKKQWNEDSKFHTNFFYIDNVLPKEIVTNIYHALNDVKINFWNNRKTFRESKKEFVKLDNTNKIISNITEAFHKRKVLELIELITNINNLEADASLYAGGVSMMNNEDFLNPHIDNSHDSNKKKFRRLNLLFYVSPEWIENNGGNLELWDKNIEKCSTIVSKFNRLVVMKTDKKSWHSVNAVKINKPRYCVSNYYFTKQSPEDKNYYHVTSFNGRPNQKIRRIYSMIDNKIRQKFADLTGLGRGKHLIRN